MESTMERGDSIRHRAEIVQRLASGLFLDFMSVNSVASYLVLHLCNENIPAMCLMDSLASAIMFAPISMRIVGARNLATGGSSKLSTVADVQLFSEHMVGVPMNYLFECNLESLYRAISQMTAAREPFYNHVRYAAQDGDVVFENFNAAREVAALAWPMLLLTLCYYHFVRMVQMHVEKKGLDHNFASDIVKESHLALGTLLREPPHTREIGRLTMLTSVSPLELFRQMEKLEATLNYTDLLRMGDRLAELATEFGSMCEARAC